MDVDERAGRDRLRGEADDLAVLAHRLAGGDVGQGDLVAQPDRLADLDGPAAQVKDGPARDRPRRHRHVVVVPQDDRPRGLDRNRHRHSSLVARTVLARRNG